MVRGVRLAAAGAAGLVLVTMGVTLANPGDELVACRRAMNNQPQVTVRPDRWVRIGAPQFDSNEGPATITAFSAMPVQKNGLLVTNGTVIKLSVDAGCTWQTIYSSNGLHAPAPGYTPDVFTQMIQPEDNDAWVSSYDNINGVPHPHVYFGSGIGVDGKKPFFSQFDLGLPSYGKPVALAAGPIGINEGYLLVDELPNAQSGDLTTSSRHLYATHRAPNDTAGAVTGPQWEDVTPASGFGRIDGFVRTGGNTVWIWSGRQYGWSSNVDQSTPTWNFGTASGPIAAIDVDTYGAVSVVARASQGEEIYQADSHGRLTARLGMPIEPYAVAHGTYQNVYVASGAKGTWGYDHIRKLWVNITPKNGPSFRSLTMALGTSARIVLGLSPTALWRWDTYSQEAFRPPPPGPPTTGDPDHVKLPKNSLTHPVLTPIKRVVSVAPGQVSQVPVSYLVNADPNPLDVYFLVDTTGSMQPAIDALRKSILSIAKNLRTELGKSACFGVGGVKDVVATDQVAVTDPSNAYVFKTFLPVDPCDSAPGLPQVKGALAKLVQGGGGDTPEAQTVGLKLAVDGGTSAYPSVPLAQPANFRAHAFKVVVYISDASSHEGGNGYPTIPDVIKTMNVNQVKVVSIAIKDGVGDLNGAVAQMTALAQGTNSVAPPSGVDCNGDGGHEYGDLGPGEPLVCQEALTQTSDGKQVVSIGPAILGLLLAVKDPGTIDVQVNDPQHALRGAIRGRTSGVFNMKRENALHFTLPVGCTPSQAGQTLPIYLTPHVRSQPGGQTGEVDVHCAPSAAKLPPLPPVIQQAAPLLIVPAVRPPVAVAPPVPPNPPAQPASNVNPNAGMAREEQNQPQLAMAGQDSEAAGEDTEVVEMSAMRNPTPRPDAMFLAGAAMLLAAAAGCSMQLRRRTSLVRQGR